MHLGHNTDHAEYTTKDSCVEVSLEAILKRTCESGLTTNSSLVLK